MSRVHEIKEYLRISRAISSFRIEECWSSANWDVMVQYWEYCRDHGQKMIETARILLDGRVLKVISNWQTYVHQSISDDVELLWQMAQDLESGHNGEDALSVAQVQASHEAETRVLGFI